MSRFYDVRGFIDCDYPDLERIREIVRGSREQCSNFALDEDTFDLYTAGWLYQKVKINWVAHAFFGASMRQSGVDLIFSQLKVISESITEAEGIFFIDGEEEDHYRWIVAEGKVATLQGKGF